MKIHGSIYCLVALLAVACKERQAQVYNASGAGYHREVHGNF
jgi:hypothetical protein